MANKNKYKAKEGFDANNEIITNVAEPVLDQDAANKRFVLDEISKNFSHQIYAYYDGATQIISDTWVDVIFDSNGLKTDGFTHILGTSEIRVESDDIYLIMSNITINITSNTRSQFSTRIMVDDGTGYVQLPSVIGQSYARNADTSGTTIPLSYLGYLTAGSKLKIQAIKDEGTDGNLDADNASILVCTIKGAKGEKGNDGDGTRISVQNEGVSVPNTPHHTLNFSGIPVDLEDQGNGVVNINFDYIDNLASLQGRSNTPTSILSSWVSKDLELLDLSNNTDIIEQDSTDSSKINIKSDGIYLISSTNEILASASNNFYTRLLKNDNTVVNGSENGVRIYNGDMQNMAYSVVVELVDGDYIQSQHSGNVDNTATLENTTLVVVKLDGVKGDTGAKGDTGTPGSGTSIIVRKDNIDIPNTPHEIIDFIGDFELADDGNGRVTVTHNSPTLPVFGTEFHSVQDLTISTSNTTSFINKLTLATSDLPTGNYKLTVNYGWNGDSASNDFESRIQLNGTDVGELHKAEPKDSAGTDPTGSTQRYVATRIFNLSLSGINALTLDWRSDSNGTNTSIFDAYIELFRVN